MNIGTDEPITVVTNATNVREGSRVVVACIGAVLNDLDNTVVSKTNISGVISCGIMCDSKMMGWKGGSEGIAVQIPDSYELGTKPPSEKPISGGNASASSNAESNVPAVEVKPLFEKKLTKEEKKAEAARKKAEKAAKKAAAASGGIEEGVKALEVNDE